MAAISAALAATLASARTTTASTRQTSASRLRKAGLYDVKRIEVLRGPQGTLYGRNSIGGVVNYVTNQPNHDGFEAGVRTILGEFNTNEWYGVVSGPISEDLAYRLNGVKRLRGGAVEGWAGSEDIEDLNDQNFALILEWNIRDNLTANIRVNDRRAYSRRNFGNGGHGIAGEGPCVGVHPITDNSQCDPRYRVARDTNYYATGFRAGRSGLGVIATETSRPTHAVPWPGRIRPPVPPSTVPTTEPAVDDESVRWPYMPSQNYRQASVASYDIGDALNPNIVGLTTNDNREEFDHQQGSLVLDWDISDTVGVKYLGAYQSFALLVQPRQQLLRWPRLGHRRYGDRASGELVPRTARVLGTGRPLHRYVRRLPVLGVPRSVVRHSRARRPRPRPQCGSVRPRRL